MGSYGNQNRHGAVVVFYVKGERYSDLGIKMVKHGAADMLVLCDWGKHFRWLCSPVRTRNVSFRLTEI